MTPITPARCWHFWKMSGQWRWNPTTSSPMLWSAHTRKVGLRNLIWGSQIPKWSHEVGYSRVGGEMREMQLKTYQGWQLCHGKVIGANYSCPNCWAGQQWQIAMQLLEDLSKDHIEKELGSEWRLENGMESSECTKASYKTQWGHYMQEWNVVCFWSSR